MAGLFLLSILALWPGRGTAKTFCFDLQYEPDLENLAVYDFTVLDPETDADLGVAHRAGKEAIAYISVGEIAPDAWYLDEALALVPVAGTNADWDSLRMDVRSPAWADFVANRLALIAVEKGFDGFFLDTVDSMNDLAADDPEHAEEYLDGMAALIRNLRATYPTKQIILNRGFEIYSEVKSSIDGMLVESLFQTRDGETFLPQDPETTFWENEDLRPIKQGGTPIYIFDYCDPANVALAWETAQKIVDLGYNALVMARPDGNVLASLSAGGTIKPAVAPVLISGPQSATVVAGRTITLSCQAQGDALTYQWQWRGINIAGANSATYTLTGIKTTWAGTYTVVVRNAAGSVSSPPAILRVTKKKSRR